jgi:hypothetical protein
MVGGPANLAIDVADISLERGEIRVLVPVSYVCFTSSATVSATMGVLFSLQETPLAVPPIHWMQPLHCH